MAFAIGRRGGQASRLADATMTQVSQLQINGKPALRYEVTGTAKNGTRITYLTTVIEGATEIAFLNTWTSTANFEYQKEAMGRLSQAVQGL